MSGAKRAQCNTCRFWKIDPDTADPNDDDGGYGGCRRRPPVIIDSMVAAEIVPPRYGQQSDQDLYTATIVNCTRFPPTSALDWCGDFEWIDRLNPEWP